MKQVYSSIKTNREMMFVVKNSQEIYSTFIPILVHVSLFRFDKGRTFGLVIFMQVYISQPKHIFSPDFTFILRFLFNITVLNAQLQEGNQHAKTFGRGCFFLSIQSLILLVIFNERLCMQHLDQTILIFMLLGEPKLLFQNQYIHFQFTIQHQI